MASTTIPETVHALAVASMNGEFCTALSVRGRAIAARNRTRQELNRVQGNE